jgi:hypothetical protein
VLLLNEKQTVLRMEKMNLEVQWMPRIGITLSQTITDNINRMVTVTKYISYTKYAIERFKGLVQSVQLDPINPGVLKLFCIATLFKMFSNFRNPRMLQTSMNLR